MGDAFCRVNLSDSKEGRELLRGFFEEDGRLKVIGGLFAFENVVDPTLNTVWLVSREGIVELLDGAGTLLGHRAKVEVGHDIEGVVDFVYADIGGFVGHGLEILVIPFPCQKEGDDENDDHRAGQQEKDEPENKRPIEASKPVYDVLEKFCHV